MLSIVIIPLMSKENMEIDGLTGTVAIFTPNMSETFLVFNHRCLAFLPPGGKQESCDWGDILETVYRETEEEVGIKLKSPNNGVWFDADGLISPKPTLIQKDNFRLQGRPFTDYLYFFRLPRVHKSEYINEKRGIFYDKRTVSQSRLWNYSMLVPGIREAILRVMR